MEDIFKKHNNWMRLYSDYHNLTVIEFYKAVKLIEENRWEKEKKKYLVMLPNGRI